MARKKTTKKAPAKKKPAPAKKKTLSADQKQRMQKWVNEGRSMFAQGHAAQIIGSKAAGRAIFAMQQGG